MSYLDLTMSEKCRLVKGLHAIRASLKLGKDYFVKRKKKKVSKKKKADPVFMSAERKKLFNMLSEECKDLLR